MTTHELLTLVYQKKKDAIDGALTYSQAIQEIQSHDLFSTEIVDGFSHDLLKEAVDSCIESLQKLENGVQIPRDEV